MRAFFKLHSSEIIFLTLQESKTVSLDNKAKLNSCGILYFVIYVLPRIPNLSVSVIKLGTRYRGVRTGISSPTYYLLSGLIYNEFICMFSDKTRAWASTTFSKRPNSLVETNTKFPLDLTVISPLFFIFIIFNRKFLPRMLAIFSIKQHPISVVSCQLL